MKARSRARELALQYLYQVDVTKDHSAKTLGDFMRHFVEGEDNPVEPAAASDEGLDEAELRRIYLRESEAYARELIEGVVGHLGEIDRLIEEAAQNWSVSRMSTTDRNILRLATCEMIFRSDIPFRVAINEGVELAKRFGSPKFPGFANGVLDRIRAGRD